MTEIGQKRDGNGRETDRNRIETEWKQKENRMDKVKKRNGHRTDKRHFCI